MGIVYKLKPEIKSAIVNEKLSNPQLSCRKLINLIDQKYGIKVSKSSINSLIKNAGLSLPVGRRAKRKKLNLSALSVSPAVEPIYQEIPAIADTINLPEPIAVQSVTESRPESISYLGALFLKAADSLLGGSTLLNEVISKRLGKADIKTLQKTELLIYKKLLPCTWLEAVNRQTVSDNEFSSYLTDLQSVSEINYDLYRVISNIIHPVRGFKFVLSDKSEFYIDAQRHTIWSAANTPLDFSLTYWNASSYIKKTLQGNQYFTLCMPPLDSYPPEEIFNFIQGLENREKKLYSVVLYGDRLEALETIGLDPTKKQKFIFGLWPTQYNQSRIVRKIGEFGEFDFKPLNQPIYLAPIEIVLTQSPVNKSVTLKGAALKFNQNEKIRLVMLSNIDDPALDLQTVARIYLENWPNLEEGLTDFNRKFEYQAYVSELDSFPVDKLHLRSGSVSDTQSLFDDYLKVLDLYVKRFFFPASFMEHDFSSMNQQFYSLSATVQAVDNMLLVRLLMPPGFKYAKDLEYACRRLNEYQPVVAHNQRLWLSCC